MNLPAAQFALIRAGRELSVKTGEMDEHLTLSQMTPLLKILDDCVVDLRRVFNVGDPHTASPLKRRARSSASLSRLFRDSDYPSEALDRNVGGIVTFGLLIDETGHIADCTIIETSGVAALDTQACALVRIRARFEPALDADGKPAKDAVTARIDWRIESPEPPQAGRI